MFSQISCCFNFIWAVLFCPKLKPRFGRFYGCVGYEPEDYEIWQYQPHNINPLSYNTPDGYTITPQTMITDGVSVPKWLGWFGYEMLTSKYFLKAGLIHDWLFDANETKQKIVIGKKPDGSPWYNSEMTFTKANIIFAEAIRTEMMMNNEPVDETLVKIFFQSVQKFGKEVWNTEGFQDFKQQILEQKQGEQ